jgi:hypothetical protein
MRHALPHEVTSFERAALPGHTLAYFQGYSIPWALERNSTPDLRKTLTIIRRLANEGYVDLCQKRVGIETEYRAIWRARRVPAHARVILPEVE